MDVLLQAGIAAILVVVYHVVRGERQQLVKRPGDTLVNFAVAFFLVWSTVYTLSGDAQRDCEASGREWVRSDPHGANGPGWECD